MVIRDLTLRSAASFGSFHLIRLLYDEYMFFLIEHKVAQSLGETPIGVMGNNGEGSLSLAGNAAIDLPASMSTPAAEEAATLPKDGESIDALLIDHEMLTKPSFDISASSNVTASEAVFKASPAPSTTKLNSIPTSTTINNNDVSSLVTTSLNRVTELQTNCASTSVIQAAAASTDSQLAPPRVPAQIVETLSAETRKPDVTDGPVRTSGSATSVASSTSTTSVSSSSILSLSTPVGVIKQAGGTTSSETAAGGISVAAGQTFVVVNTSEAKSSNVASFQLVEAPKRPADEDDAIGIKDEGEDDAAPAAKRIKT